MNPYFRESTLYIERRKTMDELIPVQKNKQGYVVVSGRDLHEFLEINTPYTRWFKRMCEYGFTENVDFTVFVKNVKDDTGFGGHRKITNHALTLDMAKEISMLQRNEKGKQARQYFIDVEKQYRLQQRPLTLEERIQVVAQGYVNIEKKLEGITEIISLDTTDWRRKSRALIAKIAEKRNGINVYQRTQSDIYKTTDKRANSDLNRRLLNLKKKLAYNGATQTKLNNTNKLDVIDRDKRLKEIYMAVVKDFAIKYKVWDQEY